MVDHHYKANTSGSSWKTFKMYKFRTMKNNAHELREDYKILIKMMMLFLKLKMILDYLRDTIIEKLSLDELPQLLMY